MTQKRSMNMMTSANSADAFSPASNSAFCTMIANVGAIFVASIIILLVNLAGMALVVLAGILLVGVLPLLIHRTIEYTEARTFA